jgi:hypothetical protein
MKRSLRILIATFATVATAAGTGAISYAAFSDSTSNTGNAFSAGTVALEDNDSETAMLSLAGAVPGATDTSCIRVTYTGSLDSAVRLSGTPAGTLAPHLTLTVTRGTDTAPSFDSCANFTPDTTDYLGLGSGVLYNGPLSSYPASASAIVDPEAWSTGEAHDYRFSVTLNDNAAAQGQSATAAFAWDAQNL